MSHPDVSLDKLIRVHYGRSLKAEERNSSGSFPVYGSSGLVGYHDSTLVDNPTIIIGRKGSVGAVTYAPEGGWTIDTAFYVDIIQTKTLDLRYLFYALKQAKLDRHTITTSIPGLNRDDIYQTKIPLPPLDEQCRIAAILDKADAIRRKRKESIRLTEEFLRSTFLEMFGDPVTNPKGWDIVRIKDVCSEIVDCVNRTAQTVDYPTPYKMVRTTNVRNYSIDLTDVRFVDEQVYNEWTRRLLPKRGDIVFTREAPAGEAGIIESDDNVFLGQRTMHFRPDSTKTTSEFLLFELMGSGISRQIEVMSAGSTVKHLSVPECKEFQVRVPPIEMQKKFSALVNYAKDARAKQTTVLQTSELLFSSSINRAFRGEL
ncbi:restriction endonuclease subunit S [Geobacter anodireducens]